MLLSNQVVLLRNQMLLKWQIACLLVDVSISLFLFCKLWKQHLFLVVLWLILSIIFSFLNNGLILVNTYSPGGAIGTSRFIPLFLYFFRRTRCGGVVLSLCSLFFMFLNTNKFGCHRILIWSLRHYLSLYATISFFPN